jgi:hypothetical protein
MYEFKPFGKIPRLNRQITVTEKIDGTNGLIDIRLAGPETDSVSPFEHGVDTSIFVEGLEAYIRAGSRNRWLPTGATPENADNFGFGAWVSANAHDLALLGVGAHYGEWWGAGIGRKYGQDRKRFSLFNTHIWRDGRRPRPECCECVPVLAEGLLDPNVALEKLRREGSVAVPGWMNPEGIIVWHSATRSFTKATCKNDEQRKGEVEAA